MVILRPVWLFWQEYVQNLPMSGWLRPNAIAAASANSLTLDRPLQLKQAENGFYYVNGTPTDCIHVGQHALADFKPDLVLSGINNGANMGDDTLYSGTVAAATEAYLMGIPAIAFSLADSSGRYWETAEKAAWILLSYFLKRPISEPILWNINIPAVAPEDIQGIKNYTARPVRHHEQSIVPMYNPRGEQIYWIGPVGDVSDSEGGTDFGECASGFITITPPASRFDCLWTNGANRFLLVRNPCALTVPNSRTLEKQAYFYYDMLRREQLPEYESH